MVFPFADHDLAGLLENPQVNWDHKLIKLYSMQLLRGTAYLHAVRASLLWPLHLHAPPFLDAELAFHFARNRTRSSTET